MDSPAVLQHACRAGTFSSLELADWAVERLLAAGFSKEQITVLSTDEVQESHFRQHGYQRPAASAAPNEGATGATGATAVATVGGLAAIALGAATGAVPLVIAGAAGVSGGSAIGGFLGAIMDGDDENEIVKFYDKELRSGRILVVVEDQSPQAESKLAQAAIILAESTSTPAK